MLNKPYYLRKEKFLDTIEYKDEEYDEENGCLKDGVEFTEEELDEALMMLDKYKLIKIVSNEEITFGGRWRARAKSRKKWGGFHRPFFPTIGLLIGQK